LKSNKIFENFNFLSDKLMIVLVIQISALICELLDPDADPCGCGCGSATLVYWDTPLFLLLLLAKILLRKTEISSRFLTFWWTCGTWVPHNFRAFYHTHPSLSTVKNTYSCYHGPLLSAEKKQNVSITNTTDLRVTRSWKT
jgi:hypothetical protein